MNKHNVVSPTNVKPCWHMESLLNKTTDGKLRGLALWYALAHAARCPGCAAFLNRLEVTIAALRGAKEASVDNEILDRLRAKAKECAAESSKTE